MIILSNIKFIKFFYLSYNPKNKRFLIMKNKCKKLSVSCSSYVKSVNLQQLSLICLPVRRYSTYKKWQKKNYYYQKKMMKPIPCRLLTLGSSCSLVLIDRGSSPTR